MSEKVAYMLTRKEIKRIEAWRGEKLTGYPHHTVKDNGWTSHYYWPWGAQPAGALFDALAAPDAKRAAKKFLSLFHPRDSEVGLNSFSTPEPRSSFAKALMNNSMRK